MADLFILETPTQVVARPGEWATNHMMGLKRLQYGAEAERFKRMRFSKVPVLILPRAG